MRRKMTVSGITGAAFALALILTGAPIWLVLVGGLCGWVVLVAYYTVEALNDQTDRHE